MTSRTELLNAMVAAAYDNGRPEWLTQLATRTGCPWPALTPSTAASWLLDHGVTTWHAVASTHE